MLQGRQFLSIDTYPKGDAGTKNILKIQFFVLLVCVDFGNLALDLLNANNLSETFLQKTEI